MMDRHDVGWRGYWVAMPTPFTRTGELDEARLGGLVEFYIGLGVHGLLVNGTTGEWFSQSVAERVRVAEVTVAAGEGRLPVVVGCTSFTAETTILLAQHARSIGAAGVCATPPPYVHPSEEEVVAFYEAVTQAVEVPWMVYNWPRGTGVDLSTALLETIVAMPNVVAVKDSTGDELKCFEACEALCGSVRFFGRFIHRRGMAILREIGGDGNIDGGGLGAPFAVPYFEALWAGDLDSARAHGARYSRLVGLLVRSDYSARWASPTAQLKAAMRMLNQPGGFVRPPLVELTRPDGVAALGGALKAAGLN